MTFKSNILFTLTTVSAVESDFKGRGVEFNLPSRYSTIPVALIPVLATNVREIVLNTPLVLLENL